ncbi:MAG: dehydratase [Chloroflexota bacterium]|nr:MAG: dehydratase [Chloroflexota bacterium]
MAEQQLCYEDVEVGEMIPPLVKHPTKRQLVQWAVATGDLYEIHYDKDFALAAGLPGVIVQGRLKAAFLAQFLIDRLGRDGRLKRWECSYRGLDTPDQALTCSGKVAKKYIAADEHCLELEVWIENAKGEHTTVGRAVAVVPSKVD